MLGVYIYTERESDFELGVESERGRSDGERNRERFMVRGLNKERDWCQGLKEREKYIGG